MKNWKQKILRSVMALVLTMSLLPNATLPLRAEEVTPTESIQDTESVVLEENEQTEETSVEVEVTDESLLNVEETTEEVVEEEKVEETAEEVVENVEEEKPTEETKVEETVDTKKEPSEKEETFTHDEEVVEEKQTETVPEEKEEVVEEPVVQKTGSLKSKKLLGNTNPLLGEPNGNKLPSPENLRWSETDPYTATWNAVDHEGVNGYYAQAQCQKGELIIHSVEGPSESTGKMTYKKFDDFFKENGEGVYSFRTRTIADPDGTDYESSDYSEYLAATQYYQVDFKIVVLDEEGTEISNADYSNSVGIVYGTSSRSYYEDARVLYPSGTSLGMVAQPDSGFKFVEYTFEEDPADLSEDGNRVDFTLAKSYTATATFQKESARSNIKVVLGEKHGDLAKRVVTSINNDGITTATLDTDGTTVLTSWPLASTKVNEPNNYFGNKLWDLLDEDMEDAGEVFFGDCTRKPIELFHNQREINEELATYYELPLEEEETFYVLWFQKVKEASIVIEPYPCGTTVEIVTPQGESPYSSVDHTVNEVKGDLIIAEPFDDSEENHAIYAFTKEATNEDILRRNNLYEGTLNGGDKYKIAIELMAKFGYEIDSENPPTVTVNGEEVNLYVPDSQWQRYSDTGIVGYVATVEHDWEFVGITWNGVESAKANYKCKNVETHTEQVECQISVEEDKKGKTYTATVLTENSLDKQEHTDEKTIYNTYNLYVQGKHVTGEIMEDILGDGTVSYDPESNTLTLNNATIEMSRREYGFSGDKNEYGIRFNLPEADNMADGSGVAVPGALTIELIGNNSIVNNEVDAETTDQYGIFTVNSDTVTYTGGGTLDINYDASAAGKQYRGIEARQKVYVDGANINMNISGSQQATGFYLMYANQLALKNKANVIINVGNGYAMDNNRNFNEDLSVETGSVFEGVTGGSYGALHGNDYIKVAQDTIDKLGVFVNTEPKEEGRTVWDQTTTFAKYPYVHIPGKNLITIHWSSIDGEDLEEPIEVFVNGGKLDEVLQEAGINLWDELFTKDGYEDSVKRLLNPITDYSDDDPYWQYDVSDDYLIETDTDIYVAMLKVIDSLEMTIEAPKCGVVTEVPEGGDDIKDQTNPPVVSVPSGQGYLLNDAGGLPAVWTNEDGSVYQGEFEGGNQYQARAFLKASHGYVFPQEAEVKVNGGEFVKYVCMFEYSDVTASVSVEHDWNDWVVVKEPTETESGLKQRTCKGDPKHVETEEIPPIGVTKYTITFKLDGGLINGKSEVVYTVEEGDTIILPTPTRDGYTFDYWQGSRYEAGAHYVVTGDHTFTAIWKKVQPAPSPIKPTPAPKGRTCQDDGYPAGYYWNGTACVKAGVPVPNTGDPTDLGLWFFVLSIALGSIYLAQRKIKKI